MRVKQARTAGFCMGVRRALEKVLAEANKNRGPIFTYGPLIHNKQVLELLEAKGVRPINDPKGFKVGTILIRAHGIPPQQRMILKETGLRLIDATCPRVARVQSIIRYHTKKGYRAVIVGDSDHAEVIGLVGYSNGQAHVINHLSDVSDLPQDKKLCVVAQTTQDEQNYLKIVEAIKNHCSDVLVFETICEATRSRQEEVRSFAGQVDGIVVVGGYHSGNTRRLVQVSEMVGLPTFHVETENDIDIEKLSSMEVVGVTAGASTPNWMIKNVVKEITAIRSDEEGFLGRWALKIVKFLFQSNLVVAFGAFSLTYTTTLLAGRKPDLIHPFLAFLYIYAMHVLNRFLDKGASSYNDPETANFYRRHKFLLILCGVCSMIGALFFSAYLGLGVFLAMLGLSILGMLYSLPIVPIGLRPLWRYSKIKDLPG
ncbi:4-hydroxy-3-methylbut-2-enyl diphosphate reductase, partial [Thermodesulfobacteriota bacterium]